MHERRLGHRVERHTSIGSTNDRARELLEGADGDGSVVVAEEQTSGRGRRGRSWQSPPGRNLLMSVAREPDLAAAESWRRGLATALADAEACAAIMVHAAKRHEADDLERLAHITRVQFGAIGHGATTDERAVHGPMALQ
jgi:hypothetical protein